MSPPGATRRTAPVEGGSAGSRRNDSRAERSTTDPLGERHRLGVQCGINKFWRRFESEPGCDHDDEIAGLRVQVNELSTDRDTLINKVNELVGVVNGDVL